MTLYQLMPQQRYHKMPNDDKSYGHLYLIDELLSMYCTRPVGLLGPFFMEVRGSQVGEVTCLGRVIRMTSQFKLVTFT